MKRECQYPKQVVILLMNIEFYKFATSANQKYLCNSECYVKVNKSIRKFRKIFLSNLYFYVVSDDRIKLKMSILKINRLYFSSNSSECVLMSEDKSVLIDDLAIREMLKKQLKKLNSKVQIVAVKETLLDEYVERTKEQQKQETITLNLVQLRAEFEKMEGLVLKKSFSQLYQIDDLILKEQHCLLVTAKVIQKEELKKSKKKEKKQEPKYYTVKIYPAKLIKENGILIKRILRQRKCLQQVLSPYIPLLYRCLIGKSTLYCMSDYYKGQRLIRYIKNENINSSNFKLLVAQVAIAVGQVHECNLVYNNINLEGIFITELGYVLLNQFGYCREVGERFDFKQNAITKQPPEVENQQDARHSWDWWALGLLIFEIKEGRSWKDGQAIHWPKQPELQALASSLLQRQTSKRIGWQNDYHQILAHDYFKSLNKKQLATKQCEPLKKFFKLNYGKADYDSDTEYGSTRGQSFKDYEFCRELQDY